MGGQRRPELKEQLTALGVWKEFLARRQELKDEGYTPKVANDLATVEAFSGKLPGVVKKPAAKPAAKPRTRKKAEPNAPGVLEVAPLEVAGKTANEPEIVRWVARNIDNQKVDAKDCPDPFAWTLLKQCRQSPAFLTFFIQNVWSKLIPNRAQIEDDSKEEIDGAVTIALIDRIRKLRDDTQKETE